MNRPRARVRSDSGCLTSAARRSLTVGRRQQSRSDGGDIDRVSTRLSHPEPTATDLFGDLSQSVVMLPSNRASSLGMIMTTFVAIDFETANHRRDSACAVGLATGCNGRIVASRTYTIRPPTPQFSFTGIHGVRWEDVRDAPTFGDLWPTLRGWIDNVEFLAAHNASFDRSVLLACCARYRLRAPRTPFTCTVQLARAQWGIYRVYPGFPTLFWGLSGFFVNDLMGKALWSSWKTRSVFQGAVGAFCASTAPSASTGPICMRQDRRVLGLQSTRE